MSERSYNGEYDQYIFVHVRIMEPIRNAGITEIQILKGDCIAVIPYSEKALGILEVYSRDYYYCPAVEEYD